MLKKLIIHICLLTIVFSLFVNDTIAQISFPSFNAYNKNNIWVGYYLFAASNKIFIIDNFGTPVYLKDLNTSVLDFNIQENNNLYYYISKGKAFYKLDSSYNIIDTISIKNDYDMDYHELIVQQDGDIYVYGHNYRVVDLRSIVSGGQEFATVVEEIIQVQDKNKNVKFEWKSLDHNNILDTDTNFVDLTSNLNDYMHINSFDVDSIGDIYISSRHLSEITKINGITGDIIWRLGGEKNEFTFINENGAFSGQHSVKILPNGKLLLFDNGNYNHQDYSRGVEYKIDENLKTIELIREFRTDPDVFASAMGNIQFFENNTVVGWGKNGDNLLLTEYDVNNEQIVKIESADQFYTYKIKKLNWKNSIFTSNLDSLVFVWIEYEHTATNKITITNKSDKEIILTGYSTHDTLFKVVEQFPAILIPNQEQEFTISFNPSRFGGNSYDIITFNSDSKDYVGNNQRIGTQVILTAFSPDINSPLIKTYPANNSINIPVDTVIEISFDEAIRNIDDSKLAVEDIKNNIILYENDISVTMVQFDALIDTVNNKIIVVPLNMLKYNQKYLLSISPGFEDFSNNIINQTHAYFTTEQASINYIDDFKSGIFIYPNPTLGKVELFCSGKIDKVYLITQIGIITELKTELSQDRIIIDLSGKIRGIYFLKIQFNDGAITITKVIKI